MDAVLIPASRQTLWGKLAVANFFLGGAGAGAYAVAALLARLEPAPLVRVASALGPLIVAAGFLAVALEAGRPLRGLNVFLRLGSSWMSREALAGAVFLLAAPLEFVKPLPAARAAAVAAALLLVVAHGFILARARGVAAWSMPLLPPLFAASGLVSGAGLLGVVAAAAGGPDVGLALGTAGLVVASALLWIAYLAWPGDAAFRSAVRPLRDGRAVLGLFAVGHVLPLVLLAVGAAAPAAQPAAAALGGVGILAGQLQAKARLVLRAGALRPISISTLTLPRPA